MVAGLFLSSRPFFRRPKLACFRFQRLTPSSVRETCDKVPSSFAPSLGRLLHHGWPLADDRVKQVKEANDIVEVVGEYLSACGRPGQTYKGLCPFHDDHHPSFDVDPRRQTLPLLGL